MQIESINIDKYISKYTLTTYARNQSKTDNLLGDRLIDRGKLKYKISLTFNLLNNIEWAQLLGEISKISFNITFYDAKAGEITRSFSIDTIPSPRFIRAGSTTYYKDINLELEEL